MEKRLVGIQITENRKKVKSYTDKHNSSDELVKLFSILEVINELKKHNKPINLKKLCTLYKISIPVLNGIIEFTNKTYLERDENTANRLELITNTITNKITLENIEDTGLKDKVGAIKDLISTTKLLRGENTSQVGIDFLKGKTATEIIEYINEED